jgi:2-keto-4-pentenoate hydratase/2-oxohepta-3-ene-1,7-dioic acid hydratase in catechol pathway
MRLLTFLSTDHPEPRIGVRVEQNVLDIGAAISVYAGEALPATMKALLAQGAPALDRVRSLVDLALADPQLFARAWKSVDSISYMPPIPDVERFLCVGKNYAKHLEELKRSDLIREMPQEPTSFIKLASSLTGHDCPVARPASVDMDYEPEMVIVIGKDVNDDFRKEDAMQYVAGLTVLNDLTCRKLQKLEVASGTRFWTAKNMPGFGPLGPEIVTIDEIGDMYDLWMTCFVNGEQRMRVNTKEQIWRIGDILQHFSSRHIPIKAGDMFSTGAPHGAAFAGDDAAELYLKHGDVVECGIEGVMTLRNTIVDLSSK